MEKLVSEYRRQPRPTAVLMVDIDHFKAINDSFGHLAGDRILQQLTQLLQNGLRESDIAVRWGGEEFLLVLRGCDLAEAQRIAENLRLDIANNSFNTGDKGIAVTISVGVAEYDGKEPTDHWINRADAGLYTAKNGGRNRVCVAPVARS